MSGAVILAAIPDYYGLDRATVTASTVREGMIQAYLAQPGTWWRNRCTVEICHRRDRRRGYWIGQPQEECKL